MKRDMDAVREILLAIEKDGDPTIPALPAIAGYSSKVIEYNSRLLIHAGFVSAWNDETKDGWAVRDVSLNWHGHEFLETVRDPEIWRRTKAGAAKAGGASLAILGEIAKGLILAKLRGLGVPVE